jgi:hypothetical protein
MIGSNEHFLTAAMPSGRSIRNRRSGLEQGNTADGNNEVQKNMMYKSFCVVQVSRLAFINEICMYPRRSARGSTEILVFVEVFMIL